MNIYTKVKNITVHNFHNSINDTILGLEDRSPDVF